MEKPTNLSADVLVIGGGIAGLMAAISARRSEKKVLLVSKGPVGRSGNTLVSGGGISAVTDATGNTADQYYADIAKSGKGLQMPTLARKLADESKEMLDRLAGMGVRFERRDGDYKLRRPPGHTVPRNIPTDWSGTSYLNRGLTYTLPLVAECHRQGIEITEGLRGIRLLKKDGRVNGAVFQNRQGDVFHISAGSVVLATGGAGYLFARTNNTRDIVGEGLAMALEAGCTLRDMEQVQFYPTMMFQPLKVTVSNPLFGAGAVLRNASGEEFMHRYDPAGNMATRDSMARAIFLEIQAGGGINGCVQFDCTTIPVEKIKETFSEFYGFLLSLGLDPTRQYLPVSPCVHYCLGGIEIDEFCRTSVPGLFGAGEICGGVHGANRLSGAALMEACVFGWQAGETAAMDSEQTKIDSIEMQSLAPSTVPGTTKDRAMLDRLRDSMWNYCSLVRSKTGLQQALAELNEMKAIVSQNAQNAGSEIDCALMVAETIVCSALLRKDSRGAHYRTDYPDADPDFAGNVLCFYEKGKYRLEFKPNKD